MSIRDIAACLAKTPGQLRPVLQNLVDQGMIVIPEMLKRVSAGSDRRIVHPSVAALRTLDSFRDETEAMLERALAKLHAE